MLSAWAPHAQMRITLFGTLPQLPVKQAYTFGVKRMIMSCMIEPFITQVAKSRFIHDGF